MARILQAIEQPHGGTAEHVLRLSTELAARGHEIEVVASLDSSVFDPLASAGIPVRRIGFVGSIWAPGDDWRALRELGRLMRDGGFDVAHAHGMKAGALTRLAALRRRLPVVYSPHQFAFVANEFRPLRHPRTRRAVSVGAEQALGLITARLVCVSEFEYERAERAHVGRPRSRRVIYHGVEVDTSAEPDPELRSWAGDDLVFGLGVRPARGEGPAPSGRRCGSVAAAAGTRGQGRDRRRRPGARPADAADRVARARRPGPRLSLLRPGGTPPARARRLRLALAPVRGPLDRDDRGDGLRPGRDREQGRRCPRGRCRLARAAGWCRRGIRPRSSSAITELAADDGLRRRMGARGREIASERFRMERMIDEIEALYLELVPKEGE